MVERISGPVNDKPMGVPRRVLAGACIAFVVAAVIGGSFVRLMEHRRSDAKRRATADLSRDHARAVEQNLGDALNAALSVALVLRQTGRVTDFASVAAEIAARNRLAGMLLVSETGVLRAPAALASELSTEQLRSFPRQLLFDERLRVIAVPAPVREGSPLVVAAVVTVEELLAQTRMEQIPRSGDDYQLKASDPSSGRVINVSRSGETELIDPVSAEIRVPGSRWVLDVAPRGGWRVESELARLIGLVLFLSLMVAAAVYDLLRRPYVLEREVQLRTRKIVETNRRLGLEKRTAQVRASSRPAT